MNCRRILYARNWGAVFLKFMQFSFMGLMGTVVHFTILVGLVHLVNLDAVLASIAGSIAGMVVNFTLNYRYTFHGKASFAKSAPRYMAVSFSMIFLNGVMMGALVHGIGLHFIVSQVFTSIMLLVLGFACNALWTFRSIE